MVHDLRGLVRDRDALPDAILQLHRHTLRPSGWSTLSSADIPPRGAFVGTWNPSPGGPLAEILVVRDEDHADTLAWLNAYFSELTPFTQWCRIVTRSQVEQLSCLHDPVGLGDAAGCWIGAILAECSVQSGGTQNLRDVPGSAAASSATFAAGRAVAVWSDMVDFEELSRRHDMLAQNLRDGSRPVLAEMLVPLWMVLGGRGANGTRTGGSTAILTTVLSAMKFRADDGDPLEILGGPLRQVAAHFDLPEMENCARGPQQERVKVLDRLGERLAARSRFPEADALLGLGACMVDPGASVAPELLRRYAGRFPTAAIWQGAYAGALAPLRVLTDQGGLGRLINKSLLAPHDFGGRPSCDIAFEELVRWLSPNRPQRLNVRGMSARALSVEVMLGVTCMFALGKSEATGARSDGGRTVEQTKATTPRGLPEIDDALSGLQRRIEALEARFANQGSLALGEERESKSRKVNRAYASGRK